MPYIALDESTAEAAPAVTLGAPLTSVGETLSSIRDDVAEQTGNRNGILPATYDKYINRAYKNLAGMIRLKQLDASFSIDTVVNQPFYMLPDAVSFLKRVSYIDTLLFDGGAELAMIDEQTFRNFPDIDATNPRTYFRYNRMLVLYPTPNDVWSLTIDCKITPQPLVNDTDSPILPVEFHEALIEFAKSRVFRASRQTIMAIQAQNDGLAIIRPLLNADAEELDSAEFGLAPARKWAQMRGTKAI